MQHFILIHFAILIACKLFVETLIHSFKFLAFTIIESRLSKSVLYICLLTIHLRIMHPIILTSNDSASVIGLHKWHTSFLQLFSQTWSNHIRRHSDILTLKHIVDNNVSHLTIRHDTHRLIPTRENHLPLACQLSLYDTSLPLYFTHCILGFICLVATGQLALWHLNLYSYDVRTVLRLAKLVV